MEKKKTTAESETRNSLEYPAAELSRHSFDLEWLETDGLGGFACGTAEGGRTRKYHGWFAPAIPPPRRRFLLVAGAEEWVSVDGASTGISTQIYGDVVHPDGRAPLAP